MPQRLLVLDTQTPELHDHWLCLAVDRDLFAVAARYRPVMLPMPARTARRVSMRTARCTGASGCGALVWA